MANFSGLGVKAGHGRLGACGRGRLGEHGADLVLDVVGRIFLHGMSLATCER